MDPAVLDLIDAGNRRDRGGLQAPRAASAPTCGAGWRACSPTTTPCSARRWRRRRCRRRRPTDPTRPRPTNAATTPPTMTTVFNLVSPCPALSVPCGHPPRPRALRSADRPAGRRSPLARGHGAARRAGRREAVALRLADACRSTEVTGHASSGDLGGEQSAPYGRSPLTACQPLRGAVSNRRPIGAHRSQRVGDEDPAPRADEQRSRSAQRLRTTSGSSASESTTTSASAASGRSAWRCPHGPRRSSTVRRPARRAGSTSLSSRSPT